MRLGYTAYLRKYGCHDGSCQVKRAAFDTTARTEPSADASFDPAVGRNGEEGYFP